MVYISDTIAQEKIETFKTEQAFTEALCWRFGFAIRFVVAIVFVLRHIIVTQQYFLVFRSNGMVSFLNRETVLSFLAKAIIEGIRFTDGCIISSLFQLLVIFHIVAEYHYLRDIQKTAETRIGKPRLHTLVLGINSFVIVLLFYFDKSQRQTIDKDGYVRAKVVVRQITASHFGGYLKRVVTNEVRGRR